MEFRKVDVDIIEEIYHGGDGISFNCLARRLKGKVSRVKLLKELRILLKNGMVHIKKDARHKQKKLFTVDPSIKEIIEDVREHEERAIRDPINNLPSLLFTYFEKIRKAEKGLKGYLRHRLLVNISHILDGLEVGKIDENSFDL